MTADLISKNRLLLKVDNTTSITPLAQTGSNYFQSILKEFEEDQGTSKKARNI